MIIKLMALTLFAIVITNVTDAQNAETNNKVKKITHEIGVQSNTLIKQILPFGGSGGSENPYLLAYHFMNTKNNIGARLHLGYLSATSANGNLNNSSKSNTQNFNGKLGVESAKNLTKGFNLFYGADFAYSASKSSTTNTQISFDTTINDTKNTTVLYGGGVGMRLTYNITKQLSIGTESYCLFLKSFTILDSRFRNLGNQNGGGWNPNIDASDRNENRGFNTNVQLPTALFLHFQF
jgi:hypothetical protein